MRIVVLSLVVACSGSSKPVPEPPAPPTSSMLDCSKVAEHVATTVIAEEARSGATHAGVKELVATRCKADAWNDEVRQCLNVIKSVQEGRACAAKLTEEQRAAIKTAARELRESSNPPVAADDPSSDWVRHVVED